MLFGTISEYIFKNSGATPASFLFYFRSFQTQIRHKEKTVGFIRIQTQIIEVEGKHADHLNTTTGQTVAKLITQI